MDNIVSRFADTPVLVAGDSMLDEYVWGTVQRISPEAPVPVVLAQRRTFVLGGAANTAANVRGLGGRAILLSIVGADEAGRSFSAALHESGIDPAGVVIVDDRPTTTKTRIVAHSQQVVRIDAETRTPVHREIEDRLLARLEELLPGVSACVLSDYAKGLVTPRFAAELIRRCREARKPVVVDPKGTDFARYRGATVVKPNLDEAAKALNIEISDEAMVREAGLRLLDAADGGAILITRGAQGMSLFEPGREPVQIPTQAQEVYDVTGAGDTVAGTIAVALAAGAPLELAARVASAAAGIVVGQVGTAAIKIHDLAKRWK